MKLLALKTAISYSCDDSEFKLIRGVRSVLVKAWNYSTWPAYKSRFWNKETGTPPSPPASQAQSRTTSYVSPLVVLLEIGSGRMLMEA